MRISKTFGERKKVLATDNPKKKFLLACEGSETERLYFDGINDAKDSLGVDALIEIVPLLRSCCESGYSHPIRILSSLMELLQQMQAGQYKLSSLIEWTIDYLADEHIIGAGAITEEEVRTYLADWFTQECKMVLGDTVTSFEKIIEQIATSLQEKVDINDCVEKLKQHLLLQFETYDPTYDCACVIVDRDKQSFKADQYDHVVETCAREGLKLYVTNPCFEFWLLLHFDEVFRLDMEKVKRNKKSTKKRNHTEVELRKLVPGYEKGNIHFAAFASRIDKAIANEKQFSENLQDLKDSVGSNIGQLITSLAAVQH